jgi:CubicO group peptidase (beta-lactamase class C family)
MSGATLLLLAVSALAGGPSAEACPEVRGTPGESWERSQGPADQGGSAAREALERYAFREEGPDEARRGVRTDGVVIVHRGRITYERYGRGHGPDTPHPLWSVAKSALSALAGRAVELGAVRLDDSICLSLGARAAGRCQVTIRHLLESASGLDWNESYEGEALQTSSVLAMLYGEGRGDMASFVLQHERRRAPGAAWQYSSGDAVLLSAVLDAALGAGSDWPQDLLFGPLGMRSAVLERDAAGTPVGSSYLHATPRDLARLGALYLADGCWAGRRLLPAGWVSDTARVVPPVRKGALGREPGDVPGRLFWLNRPLPELGQGQPWPDVPEDAFAARGHFGQLLLVVPSLELIVARTGDDRESGAFDLNRFAALAIAAGSRP